MFKKRHLKFTERSIKDQNKSKTVKFIVDEQHRIVICKLFDRWEQRWFIGKTVCADSDVFNEKKGRAIAFNKARRKELQYNIKQLDMRREAITKFYNDSIQELDKQANMLYIYMEGVQEELRDLMK